MRSYWKFLKNCVNVISVYDVHPLLNSLLTSHDFGNASRVKKRNNIE